MDGGRIRPVTLAVAGLLVVVGSLAGGLTGALITVVLIGILAGWWFFDSLVIWIASARMVAETEFPDLQIIIRTICNRAESPRPKLYLISASSPFVCSAGRSPHRTVLFISTALLTVLSRDELESVIAHELGHITQRSLVRGLVGAVVAGNIASPDGRNRSTLGRFLLPLLTLVLMSAAKAIALLPALRERAFRADAVASRLIATPESLIRALQKLRPYAESLLLRRRITQPYMAERIERLRRPA